MQSIDVLEALVAALPPSSGDEWFVRQVVPDRVYVSRDANGLPCMFLLGSASSFGDALRHSGVDHSDDVRTDVHERPVAALRLTAASRQNAGRAIAHVVLEVAHHLAEDADASNSALLARVDWILDLLGADPGLMPPERRRGLIGELLFLRRLLRRCRDRGMPLETALHRWFGSSRAKRDFASAPVAVEVKTTSADGRHHHVGSLDQLEPHDDEEVFVFSIGVRSDASAPRKLPDFVADVRSLLTDELGHPHEATLGILDEKLHEYGYDDSHAATYRREPGYLAFHLEPRLFPAARIGRLTRASLAAGELPPGVLRVMYVVDIQCSPLTDAEAQDVVDRLLDGSRL